MDVLGELSKLGQVSPVTLIGLTLLFVLGLGQVLLKRETADSEERMSLAKIANRDNTRLEALETDLRDLRCRFDQSQQEKAQVQLELTSTTVDLKSARDDVERYKQRVVQLESRVTELELENADLRKQLAEMRLKMESAK